MKHNKKLMERALHACIPNINIMTNRRINHEVVKWMFVRCQWWSVIDSQARQSRRIFVVKLSTLRSLNKTPLGKCFNANKYFYRRQWCCRSLINQNGFFMVSNDDTLFAYLVECETWVAPLRVMSRKFQRQIIIFLCSTHFVDLIESELGIYRFWSIVDFLFILSQNNKFAYSNIHEIKQFTEHHEQHW